MTVILAVKHTTGDGQTKVVIGADSAITTQEGHRFVGLKGASKLIKFQNFTVGLSGVGPVQEILELMANDESYFNVKLNNRADVAVFSREVFRILRDDLEQSPMGPSFSDVSQNIGDLIVATPGGVYLAATDLSVYEFEDFIATGVGESFATGAMAVLYKTLKGGATYSKVAKVVRQAIEIACKHNAFCNLPVEIDML